jgi:hypothetical protein
VLDIYRPSGTLTVRRLWVLIRHRLLMETADGLQPRSGTALARSVFGEQGDWTRADMFLAGFVGVKPPEAKATTEWRTAQQARLKKLRADRQAKRDNATS